jgi:hypothetical protein
MQWRSGPSWISIRCDETDAAVDWESRRWRNGGCSWRECPVIIAAWGWSRIYKIAGGCRGRGELKIIIRRGSCGEGLTSLAELERSAKNIPRMEWRSWRFIYADAVLDFRLCKRCCLRSRMPVEGLVNGVCCYAGRRRGLFCVTFDSVLLRACRSSGWSSLDPELVDDVVASSRFCRDTDGFVIRLDQDQGGGPGWQGHSRHHCLINSTDKYTRLGSNIVVSFLIGR